MDHQVWYLLTIKLFITSFFANVLKLHSHFVKEKSNIFTGKHSLHKKMMLSIKDFLSKYYQIRKKLQIWPHLLRKSWMEIVIFCAVTYHCVKKCPYSELFWPVFSRIWTKYGVILCIIVHIAHNSIFLRKLKHYSSTSELKKNYSFLKAG